MRNPLLSCLPTEVEGIEALAVLALDMRWSWDHAAAVAYFSMEFMLREPLPIDSGG